MVQDHVNTAQRTLHLLYIYSFFHFFLLLKLVKFLTKGSNSEEPPLEKKIPQILSHIKQIHDFYGHKMGTQLSRKHIFWYSMHLDREKGTAFWQSINRVIDHSEQYSKFHDFLYSI
ncbi:tRNA-dihydrouridine synthase [Candidatus Thioglobus sp.]|nr:tRNA-dihydrouridine synthase [Candidatus Thioglobus sp.]